MPDIRKGSGKDLAPRYKRRKLRVSCNTNHQDGLSAMTKTLGGVAKRANNDPLIAIACTIAVTTLYCLRLGLANSSIAQALFFSMLLVPIALGITIFLQLPILFLMRMGKRTSAFEYAVVPGFIVLLLCMTLPLSGADTVIGLKAHGHDLIRDGHIVWRHLGWMIVDIAFVEPALWASLAGLGFWWLRVKNQQRTLSNSKTCV
jgi:hypothetical protein